MKELKALERLKTHIILLEEKCGIDKTMVNPYANDYEIIKSTLKRKKNFEETIAYITQRKELAIQLRDDYKKYYYAHINKLEVERACQYYRWYCNEVAVIRELDSILEFMKGGEENAESEKGDE